MFSRSKDSSDTPIVPQTATPKRAARTPGGAPSIISAEVSVRGTLISTGDIQIEGRVDGDVRANALVVGDKAVLVGDVYAEDTIVRGRVEGSIRARKVQLCATSHVEGNIMHEALSVEIGAFFEGNCRHSDDPLADSSAAPDKKTNVTQHPAMPSLSGGDRRPPLNVAPQAAPKPANPIPPSPVQHTHPSHSFAPTSHAQAEALHATAGSGYSPVKP